MEQKELTIKQTTECLKGLMKRTVVKITDLETKRARDKSKGYGVMKYYLSWHIEEEAELYSLADFIEQCLLYTNPDYLLKEIQDEINRQALFGNDMHSTSWSANIIGYYRLKAAGVVLDALKHFTY